jgi:hypothetical protein
VLTAQRIYYFDREGGELRGLVDLTQCQIEDIEVMPSDCMKTGRSASSIWRFAINSPTRRFLFAALSEYEMNIWVQSVVQALNHKEDLEFPVMSSIDTVNIRFAPEFDSLGIRQSLTSYRVRGIKEGGRRHSLC